MENEEEILNVVNNVQNNINQQVQNNQSTMDLAGIGILIAMALKTCGLIPIIVKVAKNKSAEDISIATPIMYLVAFSILATISFLKGFYLPLLLFLGGIAVAIILLVQKINYENSKQSDLDKIAHEIDDDPTSFKFPSPYLPAESSI